jgi:hypothetical protein
MPHLTSASSLASRRPNAGGLHRQGDFQMPHRYRHALSSFVVGTMILVAAGCTQLSEQDRALLTAVRATADRAAASSAAAQSTAAQAAADAGRAATEAKAAAEAARSAQASASTAAADAKSASEKADRMFNRSLRKQ